MNKATDESGRIHVSWAVREGHKHVIKYAYSDDNEKTWTTVPQKDIDEVVRRIWEDETYGENGTE